MLDKVSGTQLEPRPEESTNLSLIEPELSGYEPLEPEKSGWRLPLFILVPLQSILMIAVLGGSYLAADRMIKNKPETKKRPAFKTVYTIETYPVTQTDHQPVIITYGQTVAARNVDLRALVSGEIVSVNERLRAGARVNKGDALVEIDGFDYEGALAEAQSNLDEANARISENEAQISLENSKLDSAQEQLTFAELDIERAERLRKSGSMTQQQLETRKLVVSQRKQALALSQDTIKVQQARLQQLRASLIRLEWRVTQAQKNLKSTTLIAPFTGIVKSSSAEIGRAITANDVVVSLYEAETLEVKFTLTDAQYGRIQTSTNGLTGRPLTLTWTVGGQRYSWTATVDRLGAEISSTRGGVEVFGKVKAVDNGVVLRPGAFVEVRIPDVVFKDTFKVPDTALYDDDKVYTNVDGKLKENRVSVAAFDGEFAILTSGINQGDQVLVTRITEVSEGLAVRIEGEANAPNPTNESPDRPSREEMARILKAHKLSIEEFRALTNPAKRKLIQSWRAKQG